MRMPVQRQDCTLSLCRTYFYISKTRVGQGEGGEATSLPVFGTQEARLLVHITNGTEVTSDDLVLGLLSGVIFSHFKHAEVQVGDWAEGAAGYENEWLLG